jgi:tetratricopeptide (TPR) repeat protein
LSKAAVYIKRLMYEDDTVDAVWMGRLGQVYQDLGEIQAYRKHYAEAIESLNHALRWYQSADDTLRQAEVHFQLADSYEALNDLDKAIEHYEKSLALDEAGGNRMSAASALSNLGNLQADIGRFEEALSCFQRSLVHDRAIRNVEGQLNTLEHMVNIYLSQNAWGEATQTCRHALTLAVQEGLSLWQASFYMKLGQLDALQKQWPSALKQYELARSIGEKALSQESLAWIDQKIAEAQTALR